MVKVREEQFYHFIEEALKELPQEFLQKLENVEFIVEDMPCADLKEKFGPRKLVGLYQGIPYPKRRRDYSLVLPDRIILYKKNLEDISRNLQELKENVKATLFHEIAHYFGISEERLLHLSS